MVRTNMTRRGWRQGWGEMVQLFDVGPLKPFFRVFIYQFAFVAVVGPAIRAVVARPAVVASGKPGSQVVQP